jgi:protease-4
MSSSRSLIGRLFGALWALINGLFRLLVILLVLLIVGGVWLAFQGGPSRKMEENAALVIYPTGQLVDSIDVDPAQRFFEELTGELPAQTLLRDLTDALEQGARDPRVALAVLKLDSMWGAGLPQLQELAAAVRTFRATGKPVYAYGPFFEQGEYLVAAQSDSVSLDPLGMVLLEGLGAYQNYFKEALDKLGVQVHVFRVGEYKSAVEPFERNDMSPEAREANREWLNDLWQSYGREVAQGRKLPETAVANYSAMMPAGLQKNGGDAAALALDSKLIDAVESLPDFRARIAAIVGWDEDSGSFRQVHYSEYLETLERERRLKPLSVKKIALVVVQGEIVDGDSEPGLAGAETIAELLTSARQDEDVAAVVLRVDSPGGSVFGSERIRRELQSLQADNKPVVVSMSSVAASGGYWVAMDADEIWAHDTTITGSIGIFALWPTFEEPLRKLGIHTDGVGTTTLAGAFRLDRPLPAEASLVMQTQLDRNYRQFIEAVAKGRDLPLEKVSEIARGRVWSGADALALGLVDQIGGLNDAIASAVRLASLEPDAYELQELKDEPPFPLYKFIDFFGSAQARSLLRSVAPVLGLTPVETVARSLRWLNDPRGIYAHCFCTPAISRGSR